MADDQDDELADVELLIERAAPDRFGVPSNLMGRQHEDFFSILGRIVALSATLENHALVMYQTLVGAGQNEFTGLSAKQLIDRCVKELHRLDSRPDDRQLVETFLGDADTAFRRRNDYVHNLWPAQSGGRLFGWRPPREKGVQEAITVEATLADMHADLASLIGLLELRHWHRLLSIVSSAS